MTALRGISGDVALTWSLAAVVLFGGFAATSRWFDSSHSALVATAETLTLQIAANERILRTKPKLLAKEHTIDRLLSHVDLDGDTPSTVAQFLRELDRTSRARNVRLVSILSGGAARDLGMPVRGSSASASSGTSSVSDILSPLPLEVVVEGRFADSISLIRSLARDRTLKNIEVHSIVHASGRSADGPRLTSGLSITLYHRALTPRAPLGVFHASS